MKQFLLAIVALTLLESRVLAQTKTDDWILRPPTNRHTFTNRWSPSRLSAKEVREPAATPAPKTASINLKDGVQSSIVLITTDVGRGTGFICRMGGTNYLVTNVHVLEGAQKFEFRTTENRSLVAQRIELANDRDLARLALPEQTLPALDMTAETPKISTEVCVLGNSDGAGVVTKLDGQVNGIGPDTVEVSAEFVSGNSGSPILDKQSAVVGVATYVVNAGLTNWVTAGTRFAGVRRFGVRLQPTIKWVAVTPHDFYQQSAVLRDCDTLLTDSAFIQRSLRAGEVTRLEALVVAQRSTTQPRYHHTDMGQQVTIFCNNIKAVIDGFARGLSENSSGTTIPLKSAKMTFRQFPQSPLRYLRESRWSTTYYADLAEEYEKIFTNW